ncbi:MAG: aminopeptidase [Candidatus Methanomethylicota archaeon]|uniref:Aminopeptidase n=1 Tax=Thermoproteota archaeon TaxID=2056631 RepID=A0A497ERP4_9CREN|nr:MAG: aminopeptidase [Candidatus Verstraetearchaeota archaeon]RLE52681.1 MAG: aminopeptidase [Candidatus Verstraetearchaeota archaeon]
MSLEESLYRVALNVVRVNLGVKSGEKFLVITDFEKEVIGRALAKAGSEVGAETILAVIKPRSRHGEEPPEPIAEMWRHVDVYVAPTKFSLTHTAARRRATEAGARGATMPGITVEMFLETMTIDYNVVKGYVEKMAAALEDVKEVRVITDLGTDVKMSVEGRPILRDTGLFTEKGAFGNLPAGEAFIAPVEGSADGVIVFDGAISGVGQISKPVRVVVENGYAVSFEGAEEAKKLEEVLKSVGRREAFNVAEIGVGCNPAAKIVGNVLEDEKVFETVHIAFGDNSTIGGKTVAGVHLDGIITKPTLIADGKVLMERGKWRI